MDHEKLVLISMLPGLDAAIEDLTSRRDQILGALGLNASLTKRRPPTVALELPVPVPPTHGVPRASTQPLPKTPPVCPVCAKVFIRPQGLASHMRQSHKTRRDGSKIRPGAIRCEYCDHVPFKSKSGFVSHMKGNHPDKIVFAKSTSSGDTGA